MLEPISILTTAATLVTACARVYTLADRISNVNKAVGILGIEISLLVRVLDSVGTSLTNSSTASPGVDSQSRHDVQHWNNVRQAMDSCKETLTELEIILDKVNQVDSGLLKRPIMFIKLSMKADDIALLKQKITAYRHTMQLSLQMITVQVSSDSFY
jgi:hypothetical protein